MLRFAGRYVCWHTSLAFYATIQTTPDKHVMGSENVVESFFYSYVCANQSIALAVNHHVCMKFDLSFTLICTQLRGMADKRQVDGAKVGLQQNFGIGGAAVVTAYRAYTAPPAWAKL